MTWVKVCGLTREQDVIAACAAGADAIGLVLVAASPRVVDTATAASLASVATVPVVVLTEDLTPDEARAVMATVGADAIQPYGRHARLVAQTLAAEGVFVLLPFRAGDEPGELEAGIMPMFDTPSPGAPGGTGRVFDWSLVEGREADFVLAGGLGADNVAEAITRLRPWGVDASSRLEEAPGIKDAGKVAAFIKEAHTA